MKDKRIRDNNRCCNCGVTKTKDNTTKDKRVRNGFQSLCKNCKRAYDRVYRKLYREGKLGAHKSLAGIDSWNQVDSVLRELSELQYRINTENDLCQQRIDLIKEYSQEITDPYIAHQLGLRSMLDSFFKRNPGKLKTSKREYCFGTIVIRRGKRILSLEPELAGKKLGKP